MVGVGDCRPHGRRGGKQIWNGTSGMNISDPHETKKQTKYQNETMVDYFGTNLMEKTKKIKKSNKECKKTNEKAEDGMCWL